MIIDGYTGTIIINPSELTLSVYRKKTEENKEYEKKLSKILDLPFQKQLMERALILR